MNVYTAALCLVAGTTFLASTTVSFNTNRYCLGRREAVAVGAGWVLAVCAENILLGPYSFLGTNAEMEWAILVQQFLAERQDLGKFSHAFTAGNDVYGLALFSGQYLALDRLLLSALPVWAVTGLTRVAQEGLALGGIYMIVRRHFGLERGVALSFGAIFSLSNQYFVTMTTIHGLSFAMTPLMIYVAIVRVLRPDYWRYVIPVMALYAISCSPSHSLPPTLMAIGLAALMIQPRHLVRPAGSVAVLLAFILLNWHESIWAKLQLAPWAFRTSHVDLEALPISIWEFAFPFLDWFRPTAYVLWLSIFLLLRYPTPGRARIIAVIAVAAVAGVACQHFPWEAMGLKTLSAVNWHRVEFALDVLVIFGAAAGIRSGDSRFGRAIVVGIAIAQLATLKAYNFTAWLSQGGLPVIVQGRQAIAQAPIPRDQPARVVSIRYRLPSNLAAVAGLDTLDGMLNLNLTSYSLYWLYGVLKGPANAESSRMSLTPDDFDDRCCERYDINSFADIDMLRMMNVGYILSLLPLEGTGITQVWGPGPSEAVPVRRTVPLLPRIGGYFREAFVNPPLRVYALTKPFPRVYPATDVLRSDRDEADPEFYRLLRTEASKGKVVVATGENRPLHPSPSLVVERFSLPTDGVEASVHAPEGGVLVVGIPFTPWWAACVDGSPAELVAVNATQMAVNLPAGARQVTLSYRRPLLRELAADKIGRAVPALVTPSALGAFCR